jgi:hypothetical protein
MTHKNNGRTGRGRATKGFVRSKFTAFDRAMQRASSAMSRELPASTWWTPPLHGAIDRMVREVLRLLATRPEARELYYLGRRLHLRRIGGLFVILDSRHRPMVGPIRLPTALARPQRAVAQQ